jgi:hypothetical protein
MHVSLSLSDAPRATWRFLKNWGKVPSLIGCTQLPAVMGIPPTQPGGAGTDPGHCERADARRINPTTSRRRRPTTPPPLPSPVATTAGAGATRPAPVGPARVGTVTAPVTAPSRPCGPGFRQDLSVARGWLG